MDIDVAFIGDGLLELWEALKALPGEVWQPALLVFIFVALLKKAKLVGEDGQAQAANLFFSYLFADQDPEALAGIALFGAVFYKIWDRYVLKLWEKIQEQGQKA